MKRVDGARMALGAAIALAVASVVSLAVATWLDFAAESLRAHGWVYFGWQWATVMTVDVLGLRIVQTRARHAIGWILIGIGLAGGLTALAEIWAYSGLVWKPGSYPGATVGDAVATGSWVGAFAGLAFLLLFFPDGRVPSVRWRFVPWLLGFLAIGAWVGASVKPGRQDDPFAGVVNPVGVAWTAHFPGIVLVAVAIFGTLGGLVAAAASVWLRFRRSEGEERAQLFWLAYAAVLVPGALVGCLIGQYFTGTSVVGDVVLPLALLLVPGSIGLAVLRYRLYDIEYLVGRTIVYGASSAVVFGVFTLSALGLGLLIGKASPFAVAAATLGAVLVARPARRRVQSWVNRRFDRDVAEGVALIDAFDEMVREGRAEPIQIEVALARALRDASTRLLVWLPKEGVFVGCDGLAVEVARGRSVTDVTRGERMLGRLVHGEEIAHRPRLLAAVVERARLGIELARLAVENAAQKAEVEASRARIVEAANEERRRLERDLHDGAQQRLIAVGVRIRRLQRALPEGADLGSALDTAVDEIGETVKDLRRLAAGIRPARLDGGLVPALEDLARTTPVPVKLSVISDRLPEGLETSAYFVACEAVNNAVKHAAPSRIDVAVSQEGSLVRVSVVDDGVGGAQLKPRSGLSGLADRVAAVGGRLLVDSPLGGGTRIEAELPCVS